MEQQYDNNGQLQQKKPFQVKIAGFTFEIKHFVIVGIIILIIVISSYAKSVKLQKEADAENQRVQEELSKINTGTDSQQLDIHSQIQEQLSSQFGNAPEGFEWDYTGNLVALGNDDDSSCEDVVYMFMRALSILDFSTAEKYSSDSKIVADYKNYYSDIANSLTDYYSSFLRKQFKKSITSLEINNISDKAVFADGSETVTISLNVLDLTDKDFWLKDKDSLYSTMRTYKETETDDVKMKQYVYDYIYSKYEDGTIGKRPITVELTVTKQNGGGWLVSGDGELCANLKYENGVNTAEYILSCFEKWYQDTTLQEQLESVTNESTETN